MTNSVRCMLAFLLILAVTADGLADAESYVAYSLGQAEIELAKDAAITSDLLRIGGMTRPLGVVCDEARGDLILVGQISKGEQPVTLDDFVVPLRAVLRHGAVPMVSIDMTPQAERTGKQAVRFEGRIENTAFGRDLLLADIVLKKLGLGILAVTEAVDSYFAMRADSWQTTGAAAGVQSRFWFLPSKESFVAVRNGVAVVNKLELNVGVEVVFAEASQLSTTTPEAASRNDEIGNRFAKALVRAITIIDRPSVEIIDGRTTWK